MRQTSRTTWRAKSLNLSKKISLTLATLVLDIGLSGVSAAALNQNVITVGPLPLLTVGSSGPLLAISSSGGTVVYTSLTKNLCTVKGLMVTGQAVGSCQILATQGGGKGWLSAVPVSISIPVGDAVPPGNVGVSSNYFSITQIGNLGGSSWVQGMNDQGNVVGGSYLPDGSFHAFLTGPNAVGIVDLGTLGAANSVAYAVNNSLEVIGDLRFSSGAYGAFQTLSNATSITNLGSLLSTQGDNVGDLFAINARGESVGVVSNGDPNGYYQLVRGLRSAGGLQVVLPGFYEQTIGNAINSRGQIGFSGASGYLLSVNANRLEANGVITVVPTPSGYTSGVIAMNDLGQMTVQLRMDGDTWAQQGLWSIFTDPSGQLITSLGSLGGVSTWAQAINNAGVVAGWSQYPGAPANPIPQNAHAFVTGPAGKGMYDVNSCVKMQPGNFLWAVIAVNNNQQLLVTDILGNSYLLTPKAGKKCNP